MSKYKKEIDDMVWSYSRLTSFTQCKYAFYLKYILKNEDEYLPEGNYYAEIGIYVHEILAMIFEGKLLEDDASQYFIDHYDENVFYEVRQNTMNKTFEACVDYLSQVDFSWLKDYDILGVELNTELKIGKYKFTGFIDLLIKNKKTGEITIIDHKSSASPLSKKTGQVLKNSQKNFEIYKKQMYLYSNAINELYGSMPKWIIWNHFKAGGEFVKIEFKQNEYENTMKWFNDTVKNIEKENDFSATPDFFYCTNLCDFRNSCEYRKEL